MIMAWAVRLCRIDDELEFITGNDLPSGTLANRLCRFFRIKDQIFHPYDHKGIIRLINVVGIPIVPQMRQTLVVIFSFVGERGGYGIVPLSIGCYAQFRASPFDVIPFGRVAIPAHALEPRVGISYCNHGQNVIFVDFRRSCRGMLVSKLGRCVLSYKGWKRIFGSVIDGKQFQFPMLLFNNYWEQRKCPKKFDSPQGTCQRMP